MTTPSPRVRGLALALLIAAGVAPAAAQSTDVPGPPAAAGDAVATDPPPPESNIRWPAKTPTHDTAAHDASSGAPPLEQDAAPPPPATNIRRRDTATPPANAAGTPPAEDSNIHWPRDRTTTAPPEDATPSPDVPPATGDAFDQALAAYHRTDDAQRYADAARLFAVAAQAGSVRASAALGYLEALGYGVARDEGDGRRRLQAASLAGLARADYLLALVARDDGDTAQEAALRESAAKRGDPVAQNAMGVHYAEAGDRTTAEMWFHRAAGTGSAAARYNLASAAPPRDASHAPDAKPPADAQALFERARRYHRGDGVAADYGQALRDYRAAAARGHAGARRMLGLIQSRPAPNGAIDPVWMRQLAEIDVDHDRPPSVAATPGRPLRLDDPLAGFARLTPR